MGLGPEGAVVLNAVIMVAVVAIILFFIYYNVNKTKKRVLRDYLEQILCCVSCEQLLAMDYDVKGLCPQRLHENGFKTKEDLFHVIEDISFGFLSLEQLKKMKIKKSSLDVYNMHQDVQDILRHAREVKEKRKKQAW
jgi:hypothetical protein